MWLNPWDVERLSSVWGELVGPRLGPEVTICSISTLLDSPHSLDSPGLTPLLCFLPSSGQGNREGRQSHGWTGGQGPDWSYSFLTHRVERPKHCSYPLACFASSTRPTLEHLIFTRIFWNIYFVHGMQRPSISCAWYVDETYWDGTLANLHKLSTFVWFSRAQVLHRSNRNFVIRFLMKKRSNWRRSNWFGTMYIIAKFYLPKWMNFLVSKFVTVCRERFEINNFWSYDFFETLRYGMQHSRMVITWPHFMSKFFYVWKWDEEHKIGVFNF